MLDEIILSVFRGVPNAITKTMQWDSVIRSNSILWLGIINFENMGNAPVSPSIPCAMHNQQHFCFYTTGNRQALLGYALFRVGRQSEEIR